MDLTKLLALEKSSEKLQELPEDFYTKAQKQILEAKSELIGTDSEGTEAELLRWKINSDQRALAGIFNKRLSKILKSATAAALKSEPKQDKNNLRGKEVKFYSSVYEAIREASKEIQ
ncbi:DNA replication complex GINS family protein [Candidatus Pacearchaeota archaeon]|jgi:DNA replication initiation complex subunit (GINS family)|nr:DNA replication complex GINS family protein [Candidatus Pacearchaeota archaeon]